MSESPPDPLSSAERKWLAEIAAVTAERDAARAAGLVCAEQLGAAHADLAWARTALTEATELMRDDHYFYAHEEPSPESCKTCAVLASQEAPK